MANKCYRFDSWVWLVRQLRILFCFIFENRHNGLLCLTANVNVSFSILDIEHSLIVCTENTNGAFSILDTGHSRRFLQWMSTMSTLYIDIGYWTLAILFQFMHGFKWSFNVCNVFNDNRGTVTFLVGKALVQYSRDCGFERSRHPH